MKVTNILACCFAMLLVLNVAIEVRGDDAKPISLDTLTGKYEGKLIVHRARPVEYPYQAKVAPADKSANTVSLVAHCEGCQVSNWERKNCKITEVGENIKFVCKAEGSDESYVFNGERLKATGFGSKFPYSIETKKIVE